MYIDNIMFTKWLWYDKRSKNLCWRVYLCFIYENNLVHGHLHRGNVLVKNEADSIDAILV